MSKTKRPQGFSRQATAIFAASVALLGAGPACGRAFVFSPEAHALRESAKEKLVAQREAEAARRDFVPLTFREYVALVSPRYKFFKHCEVLGDVLQRVADGEISRLMIFMPPRHGKSEETSRLFSAYFLYRYPERKVGLASYSAGLAYTLSRAAKDFYLAGGGTLRSDAKAVKQWETPQGGMFWAAGVGGEATGKGWHLGIIDDSLKNAEQAASVKIREKQKEWFQSTFSTREEPEGGALILIQTRWNEDDLSGWQLAQEMGLCEAATAEGVEPEDAQGWHIVNFAAIKEAPENEPKFPPSCTVEPDWRETGQALCPERYPLKKLRRLAAQVGTYFWNALFQQQPQPKEGGLFKREWFSEFVGAVPVGSKFVRYWDKAGTEGGGDYTAGVLVARCPNGMYFIVDVVRGQWAATQREAIIKQTAETDQINYGKVKIWLEQESGSGGKDSATSSIINLAGFAAEAESVSGSGNKELRADPLASQCGVGNVKLVRGAWIPAFLAELCSFPRGTNDDQVDAASGAFNKLHVVRGSWGQDKATLDKLASKRTAT